jgi:agmatine deiminase
MTTSSTTRWPAEWEPHERTVMCWPTRTELWGNRFADAEQVYAEVASTISRFEPVTMIARRTDAERAAACCGTGVDVVELPIDDSWFRDTGPTYVVDDAGERVALDWTFNSWGEKFLPFDDDAAVGRRWAAHANHAVRKIDMVLEGGSITGNGAGIIATTEQCLLNPNRNPRLSRADIERELTTEFGAQHVVWLPFGLALDDDTDGHVDNVAAFAATDHLILQGCADEGEADFDRMAANRHAAVGHVGSITEVPVLPFTDVDGERVVVPYLNFYIGNGFVLVPTCGHAADDDMLALIGAQFSDREVIGSPVGAVLAHGGGGIHCITQQVPAAPLSS